MKKLKFLTLFLMTFAIMTSCSKDSVMDSTAEATPEVQQTTSLSGLDERPEAHRPPADEMMLCYGGTIRIDANCDSFFEAAVNWCADSWGECQCILAQEVQNAKNNDFCYYVESYCELRATNEFDFCNF